MSRRDFWESTAREIFNVINGFYDFQNHIQKENRYWERLWTCILLNTQVTKQINPTELIKFEWEREQERKDVKIITAEELKDLAAFYDKPGRKILR